MGGLQFLQRSLRSLNGQRILRAQIRRNLDINIDTDAVSAAGEQYCTCHERLRSSPQRPFK